MYLTRREWVLCERNSSHTLIRSSGNFADGCSWYEDVHVVLTTFN